LNGTPTTTTVNSDASGVIEINNLAAGIYESIVVEDTVTNCIANVATITLENPVFTLTSSFTNPTGCIVNDGIITLQGATANTAYTISYSLNGTPTTTTVNSDALGIIEINNLAAGIYNNITIEENGSGCTFVFSFIELTCEVQIETCFKIRKFFTPNNDGFNDTWQLEQEQNCDYSITIYDRFGKVITILTPNYPEWDGTYRGRKLPSSDYWISIHYTENGQQLKFSTNITLKR
jgi:gliding motility-associated-like protein